MRRFLAILFAALLLVMCMGTSTFGEQQIDLEDMPIEELKALRDRIDARIRELEGENAVESDYEPQTIETKDGILVIKGYSIIPQGFNGFSNDNKYDNYSIFTVHATLTVKGNEPKSSWSTFQTQAYQNGIDTRRYTDFSKKVGITTKIMPDTPVDIDYDFLVETSTDPVTFMVKTWGKSKTVFKEVVEFNGTIAIPKK